MEKLTQIHFVRHGEVHNPQGLFYGRLPGFRLSEEGRRQAQAAAHALRAKPLAAVFSSPMQRARETAELIAAVHDGLTVRTSQLLIEIGTPFDGRPLREAAARHWDVYSGSEAHYEQPGDILARAQQFITQVRDQLSGRQVAAVTHGDVLAFLMLWAKGIEVTAQNKQPLYRDYIAQASITTFIYRTASQDEVPSIEYLLPY